MSNGGAQFWSHQFIDSNGNPYSGVKVYHYASGTTTLKNVWSDEDKATTAAQPVVGNTSGMVSFYADGDYKLVIKDSADVTLYTWDNVKITSDTMTMWEGNANTAYPAASTANRWQQFLKHDASYNMLAIGVNTGSAFKDITLGIYAHLFSSFTDAVTAAAGKTLIIMEAITLPSGDISIPANVSLEFKQNGSISKGSASSLTILGPIVGNPMHQLFIGFAAGEIKIAVNYGNPNIIRPIWFGMKGDNTTTGADNNAAWAVCFASIGDRFGTDIHAYAVFEFEPNGIYKWTSTMTISERCIIRWNKAKLDCTGDKGQSNVAINITSPDVTIYDGPYVYTTELSTHQATNGIGIRVINDGVTLYEPNISEFTTGFAIVADGEAVIGVSLHKPTIANCVTLFDCSTANNGSFNNINTYGGYIHNPNLVSYTITNARNIKLDGGNSTETSDGVNFFGTIIESADINGGTKIELIDVDCCLFDGVYYDNSSIVTTGKDIFIDSTCNNITFIGGATIGNQIFDNHCTSLTIIDPTKGMVLSGGRRLLDSTGATDEHVGYMQKWILQDDAFADDAISELPDATAGILFIHAGVEGGMLLIKADGTVTIVNGTANLVNTDTDTKLCVYENGDRAVIKNRLGSPISIRAEYTYK